MVVRARGEVEFYKVRGTVDFKLAELDTDALMGKVAAERARLIQALVDEDLFDRQRRMRVATLPLRVGLVASPGTEGFHDFLGGLRGSGSGLRRHRRPDRRPGQGRPGHGGRGRPRPAGGATRRHRRSSAAVAPRPTSPPSTRSRWPGPSPPRRCPCGPASATRATSRWPTRWPTGRASRRPSAVRSWHGWHSTTGDRWRRRGPPWRASPATGCVQADKTLAGHQRAMSTGARNQLDRHADGLVHRARALRSLVRGQVDTHAERLVVAGSTAGRAAGRAVRTRQDVLEARARRLAALPVRRLEVEELRTGQRRRLLGAYDYQRQLERGYSVTRGPDGSVLRSVTGPDRGRRCSPPSSPTAPSTLPSPTSLRGDDDPDVARHRTRRRRADRPRDHGRTRLMATRTPQGHGGRQHAGRRPHLLRRRRRARRDHRGVRDRGRRRRPPGRPARAGHGDRRRARPTAASHPHAGRGAGAPARGHRTGRTGGGDGGRHLRRRRGLRGPVLIDRRTGRRPVPPSRGRQPMLRSRPSQ